MRSLALLIVLVLGSCAERPLGTLAQLHGTVVVGPGLLAPGATVSLPSLGRGTVTDADGAFAFDAVPFGG